jgi:hypothetical protein
MVPIRQVGNMKCSQQIANGVISSNEQMTVVGRNGQLACREFLSRPEDL